MVAPVFGHSFENGQTNLVAILQLLNKVDGFITNHDVVSGFVLKILQEKMKNMSGLIGRSV